MKQSGRYLCFNLGKEEFAIALISVREVLAMPTLTPIPQSPSHFLGITNLRGQIIPVIDLRSKLGIKSIPSEENAVVILEFGESPIGVAIDQANSVQQVSGEELKDKPNLGHLRGNDYIEGVFRREENLILILNIDKALSDQERSVAKKAQQAA
ncbi:MAG: chemotaxis protein CheW [Pseudobdellovibrionaceae bacterium]